ncbi:MAG: MarR family winged helix-turn-helix transcriptional regulator [Bacillota bacterium]
MLILFHKERSQWNNITEVIVLNVERKTLTELVFALMNRYKSLSKEAFKQCELSAASLLLIRQVAKSPGITVSALAQRTGIAKSHVSRVIEGFAQQGYVVKTADSADQRLVRLTITEPGMALMTPLESGVQARLSAWLDRLPDVKAAALREGLEALMAVAGQDDHPKEDEGSK